MGKHVNNAKKSEQEIAEEAELTKQMLRKRGCINLTPRSQSPERRQDAIAEPVRESLSCGSGFDVWCFLVMLELFLTAFIGGL